MFYDPRLVFSTVVFIFCNIVFSLQILSASFVPCSENLSFVSSGGNFTIYYSSSDCIHQPPHFEQDTELEAPLPDPAYQGVRYTYDGEGPGSYNEINGPDFIELIAIYLEYSLWKLKQLEFNNGEIPNLVDFGKVHISNKRSEASPSGSITISTYGKGGTWEPWDLSPPIELEDDLLAVTCAHELFHLFQYTYSDQLSTVTDGWIQEGTAVWMEDCIFDQSNSYVGHINFLYNDTNQGFFDWFYSPYGIFGYNRLAYASVSFWKYLTEQLTTQSPMEDHVGSDVMLDIWNSVGLYPDDPKMAVDNYMQNTVFGSLDNYFVNWILANKGKDLLETPPNTIVPFEYLGDEQEYYPHVILANNGKQVIEYSGYDEFGTVDDYASLYYHFRIPAGLENVRFQFHAGYYFENPFIVFFMDDPNDAVIFKRTDVSYYVPSDITDFYLIVGALDDGGNFSLSIEGYVVGNSDTLYVPQDGYTSIQAAIDDSEDGNVIVVDDGIYTGAGNYNINYGGRSIILTSANGPENCVIDCEGNGRGFSFINGEEETSVLRGFTIMNGVADVGGGIYCLNSSPTIENNIIISNEVYYDGGGIYCYSSSPVIRNNEISYNVVTATTQTHGGAGISCWDDSSPAVICNVIRGNYSGDIAGGILVRNNTTVSMVISNNLIVQNTAGRGGGVAITGNNNQPCTLVNNTIASNYVGAEGGGGMFFDDGNITTIINTSVWDNESINGAQMRLDSGIDQPVVNITYSDVEGGLSEIFVDNGCTLNWNEGMIDYPPYFVGEDYRLSSIMSPCIDAGFPSIYDACSDSIGLGGIRSDMGAYGGPSNCGWSGSY